MTQQNREPSLNNLPSPRSPKALDERIIAHARAAAPSPQDKSPLFAWNGPWLGGLASTAVLVVAILIAVPTLRELPSQEHQLAADAAPISRYDEVETEDRQQALEEVAVLADSSPIASKPVIQQRPFMPGAGYSSPRPNVYQPAPAVHMKAKPKRAKRERSTEVAASEREAAWPTESTLLKLKNCGKHLISGEADSAAGSAALARALGGLNRGLDKSGSGERCYEALQKDCADCDWPPTLKEALEAYGNVNAKTKTKTGPKTP